MKKNLDLIFILLFNLFLIAVVIVTEYVPGGFWGIVRLLAGIIYVVFVPGYALQAALLPWRKHLSTLDRIALSLGLSIAIMPILGLLLDGPFGGIFLAQSLAFLTAFTALCSLIAIAIRGRVSQDDEDRETIGSLREWWQAQSAARKVFAVSVPAAIMLGIALAAGLLIMPHPGERLTEFYLIGTNDAAINYPDRVTAGEPFTLRVGVANYEGSPQEYQIEVRANGSPFSSTNPFALEDGQSIQTDLAITLASPGTQTIDLYLLRAGQPVRRLVFTADVK
jgi:uncharacterized membrane protein